MQKEWLYVEFFVEYYKYCKYMKVYLPPYVCKCQLWWLGKKLFTIIFYIWVTNILNMYAEKKANLK